MNETQNWIDRVRDAIEVEELAIDTACCSEELNEVTITALKRGAMRAMGCAGYQVEAVALPDGTAAPKDVMMQVASLSECEKLQFIGKLFVIGEQCFGLGRSTPVVIIADKEKTRNAWIDALAYAGVLKNRAPILIVELNIDSGLPESYSSVEAATLKHGVRSMLL